MLRKWTIIACPDHDKEEVKSTEMLTIWGTSTTYCQFCGRSLKGKDFSFYCIDEYFRLAHKEKVWNLTINTEKMIWCDTYVKVWPVTRWVYCAYVWMGKKVRKKTRRPLWTIQHYFDAKERERGAKFRELREKREGE